MVIQAYSVTTEWFYLFIVAILEAQMVYTWQFRKMPGAMTVVIAQTCKMIFLLSLVMASASINLPDKIFWITVQKVTAVLLPNLWLVFTLQISQRNNSIPPLLKYGLSGIICGLSLLLIFNWQGLAWHTAWLEDQKVFLLYGPGHMVATAYSYMIGILTTILTVRWIVTTVGLRRRQALWYSFAVLISWVSHCAWRVSGGSIESVPWGFLINGAVVTWIYYRWQFYNIVPLAQAVVSQHVIEGLLIIDDEDYIVDINIAAQKMFEGLPVAVGGKFQAVRDIWPALGEAGGMDESTEVEREHPTRGHCNYRLRRIPLQHSFHQSLGWIILLYDLTEQKRDQAQFIEQQKSVAVMEERANLARELHDNLCQTLGYINIQSQATMKFASKGQTAATVAGLSRLNNVAQRAYDDVREYIHGVHITKMNEQGLRKALKEYVLRIRQDYGVNVELDIPDDLKPQIDAYTMVQLLRIAQEALTNSIKHAEASHLVLSLKAEAAVVVFIISDDGKGFDPRTCSGGIGYGLTTMCERAEKIGAALEIVSEPGKGTKVIVEVPQLEKEMDVSVW